MLFKTNNANNELYNLSSSDAKLGDNALGVGLLFQCQEMCV